MGIAEKEEARFVFREAAKIWVPQGLPWKDSRPGRCTARTPASPRRSQCPLSGFETGKRRRRKTLQRGLIPMRWRKSGYQGMLKNMVLGVESPFSSRIVLFRNHAFAQVFGQFLKSWIPEENGEGTARSIPKHALVRRK